MKKIISALFLLVCLCSNAQMTAPGWSPCPSGVMQTNPPPSNIVPDITWWNLTEGSGTTLNDSSPGANTGTLQFPSISPSWVATATKYSLSFTAADDQNGVGINTVNTGTVTVSVWVKINGNPSGSVFLVGFSGGGAADKILFITSAGYASWDVYSSGHIIINGSTSICDNNWHWVVGTADGTNSKLYVDSVMVASTAAGSTYAGYSAPNINISGEVGSYGYMTGLLYDFRVYSYALTQAQINTQYLYQQP